ncbi:MAG: WD40 repeat domain-containing protein, partial [Anaerolineae bacterium]|nr:WD40 repeat domain-containing protein [Anaerolineae bacterium]
MRRSLYAVCTLFFVLLALITEPATAMMQGDGLAPIKELDWNSDGTRLAVNHIDGTISIWDQSGTMLFELVRISGLVSSIDWHPTNRLVLASSSYDDTYIQLWNGDTGSAVQRIETPYMSDGIDVIRWSQNGTRLIVGGIDKYQVWNSIDWTPATGILTGSMWDIIWDGDDIALVSGLGDIVRIQLDPLLLSRQVAPPWLPLTQLSWHPDGTRFVGTGRLDPILSSWTAVPLTQTQSVTIEAIANDVVYVSDSQVAIGLDTGDVIIMNPETGEIHERFSYGGRIFGIAWNPVYRILASGGSTSSDPIQSDAQFHLSQPTSILPPTAALTGMITLPSRTSGTAAYAVPLSVRLADSGGALVSEHSPTTDVNGTFTLQDLP